MEIFELMKNNNHEQVAFYTDKSTKLRALLAIHSTALGPAIGGIRIYKYRSVDEAMFDLLRLSQAMTYKAAAGGINFGGGYMLVVQQEGMEAGEPLFRALGRFIESLKGRFIAGGEIGVTEESMEYIKMETEHLSGLPAYYGGSGDHSNMCAYGTFMGLKAAAQYQWGSNDLEDKKIVVQGYGRIGSQLAASTERRGAKVLVADIDPEKIKLAEKDGFQIIDADKALAEPCDILAPCAVGSVVTPETIAKFQCKIIAGSANNQLLNPDDALLLKKNNILYAPDFIINVGGIIDVSEEYLGYKKEKVKRKTENIYDRVLEILEYADQHDISTNEAALQYAKRRIEAIKQIKGTHLHKKI